MNLQDLKELRALCDKVTKGPWIRSGVQVKYINQHGPFLAAGPDRGLMFFSPLGTSPRNQAACIRDMDYIAKLDPQTVADLLDELISLREGDNPK